MDCWKNKKKVVRSIGIAGSFRGSGATHLSVALANYAASGLGEKTAYLELDGHGEMSHWKTAGDNGCFRNLKIDFYPDFKREQIPILWNQSYEKIIMDFGDSYERFREELLRCDQKIFLLNLNPWQESAARNMVNAVADVKWGGIEPIYASVNAQEGIKRAVEKECGISVTKIPMIPNPNCVRAEEFPCMDFILGSSVKNGKRKKSLMLIKRKR